MSELSAALRKCGMYVDDARLKRMFDEADEDRSGGIDVDEFEKLAERLMAPSAICGSAASAAISTPVAGLPWRPYSRPSSRV